MTMADDEKKGFNFDKANLSDQITCIGELEHIYYHALKAASTLEEEEAVFYLTLADMVKQFRREYMREHFPKVGDKDWCILKAIETIRQRVYESSNLSYKNIKEVNDLWSMVTEHIFGVDMSGCQSCEADRKGENEKEN